MLQKKLVLDRARMRLPGDDEPGVQQLREAPCDLTNDGMDGLLGDVLSGEESVEGRAAFRKDCPASQSTGGF
ncbi:MAG: hypothetical protein KDA96_21035 [Planctomycetaceae bacterium]|nr:hypothetical protein [Planctomycetaceae bacterium]